MTLAQKRISTEGALPLRQDFRREFVCPEESMRYAGSLQQLLLNKFTKAKSAPTIIEFGSGTGAPIVAAILGSKFPGVIHGYEVNAEASEIANDLAHEHHIGDRYIVHNISFFETKRLPKADYLIANPPYLPCADRAQLILPDLCGGPDGNDVTKSLLSCGYENVVLEISSYSNPEAVLDHAQNLGYSISDFLITQMPFGNYSRQDVVQKRLYEMKEAGTAFFTDNCYLVGSAFFTKTASSQLNLSADFMSCLTALRSSHI